MSHPSRHQLLPAEDCIEALIVAGGNVHLAAERLFGPGSHGPALLTASIAQDPLAIQALNAQLRTLTTLQAFDALHEARVLLPAVLQELEPKDFANYYLKLVQSMREFTEPTDAPATPGDALARLINMLPPDARRAFMVLVDTPPPTLVGELALGEGEGAAGSHELDAMEGADSTASSVVQPTSHESESEAA